MSEIQWERDRWPNPALPASEVCLPTQEEAVAEANRILAAHRQPTMPVRPKFDLASAEAALADAVVKRDAAFSAFSAQVEVINRAEAAILVATRACDEYADLDDAVSEHFANQMKTGVPVKLSRKLEERASAKRAADQHHEHLEAARLRVHNETEPFRTALAKADTLVLNAAMLVVRCRGEELAERVEQLREEYVAATTELSNIAAVILNGRRFAEHEFSELWLKHLREPVPTPQATPAGMKAWNTFARNLLTGRA